MKLEQALELVSENISIQNSAGKSYGGGQVSVSPGQGVRGGASGAAETASNTELGAGKISTIGVDNREHKVSESKYSASIKKVIDYLKRTGQIARVDKNFSAGQPDISFNSRNDAIIRFDDNDKGESVIIPASRWNA